MDQKSPLAGVPTGRGGQCAFGDDTGEGMRTARQSVVGAIFGILLAGAATPAAATVTVAALTGYPPFSGEKLRNTGFSNDVIATALRRTGHEVRVKMMPWPRALRLVKEGEHEVLSSVWYTEEREEQLAFTDPIARNRLVFVTRRGDSFTYDGLESLTGKTVGVAEDYQYGESFMSADNFERKPGPNLLANLFAVDTGAVDMLVADELSVRYLIDKNRSRFSHAFEMTDETLSSRDLHAAVSRAVDNTAGIVRAINKGLTAMHTDGTYARILREHGLAE